MAIRYVPEYYPPSHFILHSICILFERISQWVDEEEIGSEEERLGLGLRRRGYQATGKFA